MANEFIIKHGFHSKGNSQLTGSLNVSVTSSAAVFSGSTYYGDGSNLTGIVASNWTSSGDGISRFSNVQITGSLIISSSLPLILQGSGSTLFDVQGTAGTLFSIDDSLSGSLFTVNDISGLPQLETFSDGKTLIGASPRSLYTTAVLSSTTASRSQSLYLIDTGSYDGAFYEYTAISASDARAGTIMSTWIAGEADYTSSIVFTETTTADIGDTSGVYFSVEISQSLAALISKTDSNGWKIKTIIRSI